MCASLNLWTQENLCCFMMFLSCLGIRYLLTFLSLRKKNFLVVKDYYSKYTELVSLPNITCKTIIDKCKSFFAIHGHSYYLCCWLGYRTQFTAKEFKDFALSYEFNLIVVSPKHCQSNGQAESGVKIAKNILMKTEESQSDIYLCLLDYRNTCKPYQTSPAELMFTRKLNSLLPLSQNNLVQK